MRMILAQKYCISIQDVLLGLTKFAQITGSYATGGLTDPPKRGIVQVNSR